MPAYRRIIIFFAVAIVLGTLLLSMPFAISQNNKAGTISFSEMLLRNIFTATSSVCVTGLSVVDIATYYSHFGQIVILFMIQIGALGYVLFATASGILIGRVPLKERLAIKELVEPSTYEGLLSLLKNIIKIVFVIEIAGAAVLTILFTKYYSLGRSVYYGVFHSISAFANAGFSLFPTNLEVFRQDIYIMGSISILIILGGLGFLVISDLISHFFKRKKLEESHSSSGNSASIYHLTLHTKMVLFITGVLIIAGGILFLIFEHSNSRLFLVHSATDDPVVNTSPVGASLSPMYKVANAFFMSITSRTAGFNTLRVQNFMPATFFMLMILMFIGASPGGTGGGIKTTTFGVVVMWIITLLRGKNDINLGGRRLPFEVVRKASVYLLLALFYCLGAIGVVLFFEKNNINPLWCCFEVISAFGTVGLSAGITPYLGTFSKIVIIITMLIGRVGLLTLAFSALSGVSGNVKKDLIQYPEERVVVG